MTEQTPHRMPMIQRQSILAHVIAGVVLNLFLVVLVSVIQPQVRQFDVFSWQRGYLLIFFVLPPAVSGYYCSSLFDRPREKRRVTNWLGYVLSVCWVLLVVYDDRFIRVAQRQWYETLILLVPLVGTFVGGWVERRLFYQLHAPSSRETWSYETRSGHRCVVASPRPVTLLGRLYVTLGFASYLGCLFAVCIAAAGFSRVSTDVQGVQAIFDGFVYAAVFFFMAKLLRNSGERLLVPAARETLELRQEPLIVYLRSFDDDRARLNEGLWGQLDPFSFLIGAIDQTLARECRQDGPFVAIGRPDEILPESGAMRIYVPEADWQQVVLDLIERAKLVVIQLGQSDGLLWEMNVVSQQVPPNCVLLVVPSRYRRGWWFSKNRRYQSLRQKNEPRLNWSLPQKLHRNTWLICSAQADHSKPAIGIGLAAKRDAPHSHPHRELLRRLIRRGNVDA